MWLDHSERDASGFLTSPSQTFATSTYAITSDRINLGRPADGTLSSILGTVRVRATASNPTQPVFIGIGPSGTVNRYLASVAHVTVVSWVGGAPTYDRHFGAAPIVPPTALPSWVRSAYGTGTRSITWKPTAGDWTVVAMRPDGSSGLSVVADVGATIPALGWISAVFLAVGAILLIAAVLLITLPFIIVSRRSKVDTPWSSAGGTR